MNSEILDVKKIENGEMTGNSPGSERSKRRLRSDAIWNQMTEEQQRAIHKWLYDEPLSYREILRRLREELGLDISHVAVCRIYQRELKFDAADEVADGQSAAEHIAAAGANLAQIRAASMQMANVRLLQKVMDHDSDTKEVAALGRLVLDAEEKEIQRERTALARERFQFKAAKAALDACLAQQINQEELERETARVEMIKNRLFGKELYHIIE